MELIYTVIKFLTIYSISAENFIFLNKYFEDYPCRFCIYYN